MISMARISPRVFRSIIIIVSTIFGFVTLLRLHNNLSPGDSYSHLGALEQINWSRFAYTQYATDRSYLCNSLMIFEALDRLGSNADRLLMYPSDFLLSESDSSMEARLLRFARDEYSVKLKPIDVIMRGGGGVSTAPWSASYTKLLAFNQTEYDRVINLDSDATLLQAMDELFLLPSSSVAMPRAYWLDPKDRTFTSGLMLVQPSEFEFGRIMDEISNATSDVYDMEIMNKLYGDSALVIPHRPYTLLTGEFRSKNHEAYLGNTDELWDAEEILKDAKYLHFSDWPVPKPWIAATRDVINKTQPPCEVNPATGERDDCRLRELWLGIYKDFMTRRQVCQAPSSLGSIPYQADLTWTECMWQPKSLNCENTVAEM
ncbi:CAZyme family GT8 [Penicillium maclennaniae]|uniref:CAZyme family GT8 n=1 Tax=Penicillium maclennaniae TaxID=1343394 RepID=UPI00253F7156|nr:CAZyme family GT8 [Penicillium maclennaniae]KAJ5683811.1 CAZyme family GT8 [Penicillium maclennaniae]